MSSSSGASMLPAESVEALVLPESVTCATTVLVSDASVDPAPASAVYNASSTPS